MQATNEVIFIENDIEVLDSVSQTLRLAGMKVHSCNKAEQAFAKLSKDWPGIVLTDVKMPVIDGFEVLKRLNKIDAEIPVILITGHGDIAMALQSLRQGAYDFIEKPANPEYLIDVIHRAIERRELVLENRYLKEKLLEKKDIETKLIGRTEVIERLRKGILQLSNASASVLIMGETGSGKEVVARCLHECGNRQSQHFVAINCGALPETLMESELFGHEVGAFTGATKRRVGKIEYAQNGTLFLDEIESMPMSLQTRLLRVLQEKKIERLGSNQSIGVNIRIVAASKVDLLEHCQQGEFREDLYYRLNVAKLSIPPLRERRDDVELLFKHFVAQVCERECLELPTFSDDYLQKLQTQQWLGNVRELHNEAERFALNLQMEWPDNEQVSNEETISLDSRIDAFEKSLIEEILKVNNGQVSIAAQQLHIPRKRLYLRMKKHQLDKTMFKGE